MCYVNNGYKNNITRRISQAVHDTWEVYDGCRKTEFCKQNLYLNNFIRIMQILYLFQNFLEK